MSGEREGAQLLLCICEKFNFRRNSIIKALRKYHH